MFTSVLTPLVNAGLQGDLPDQLRRRVKLTNVVALLIMAIIGVPFCIISAVYFPQLTFLPLLGVVICIGVIATNYLGGIYYSRLVIALLPLSLGAVYNAYLCQLGEEPIASLYLIQLSFSLIPFILFDLEERGMLLSALIISSAVIVGFPVMNGWFEMEIDATVLREGWLKTATIFLAVVIGFSCVLVLALLNKQSETESKKLLRESMVQRDNLQKTAVEREEDLRLLQEAQSKEQRRNWATEGVTRIAELLRTGNDASEVYDRVLAQLITYLNANQGGLYVVHEAEDSARKVIRLTACYAYARKKYLVQEYEIGQGLLGQSYLESDYLYLTDLPAEYVRITSGLGEATPTALLVMPLKVNEAVEGLVEIALFHQLKEHEIHFVAKAGESIASYIQTNRINERTARLLAETTQNAEALRAQEEELRQNLEELAATQEAMHRKEQEYLRRIEALQAGIPLAE
ncbi:MAG: GAF domain-containing protein [Ferruginibacter sp.]|nr:GAF domain-containing protein [Cytophagales bacterium]